MAPAISIKLTVRMDYASIGKRSLNDSVYRSVSNSEAWYRKDLIISGPGADYFADKSLITERVKEGLDKTARYFKRMLIIMGYT
jgi:hypothetical protein